MVSTNPQVWLAAFFTIAATSYAFKDNVVFKFSENTFIGAAAGHAIVMGVKNVYDKGWGPLTAGQWFYIIPFVLGIMIYARFHKTYFWLYRYAIAFLVGQGTGIGMRAMLDSDFVSFVRASAAPLVVTGDAVASLNRILIVVLCLTALTHFLFTFKQIHTGTLSWLPRIGRYGMLLGFGASFGNTVMSRFGMYQGRMVFLLKDWLGLGG